MSDGENSNKFIVVFDDGTFYVFFRSKISEEKNLNDVIRIPSGHHNNVADVYKRLNDPNF